MARRRLVYVWTCVVSSLVITLRQDRRKLFLVPDASKSGNILMIAGKCSGYKQDELYIVSYR
jgi:hypothetical protein